MAIPLPDSLRLQRDTTGEKDLYDKARAWLAKEPRTPGIHASSLLDPRLAYFQHGKPEELTDKLVCMFLIGKVLHAFVLSAADGATGTDWATDSGSKTSEDLGIQYSIDRFKDGVPIEFKTSRKPYEPRRVSDIDTYLEQVLIYMAAENSTVGKVWVLFTGLKDTGETIPRFRCYTVTISKEDLEALKHTIREIVMHIDMAIANPVGVGSKEFKALPLCHAFKCGPKNCKYWDECQPEGRWPKKTRGAWKA